MPASNNAGKDWIGAIFMALKSSRKVQRVLDVGAGRGTYSDLGRTPDAEWIGIEAWGPYIKEFNLNDKYNKLIISDARYLDYSMLGNFDVCFLGDVLEHMSKEEACFILERVSLRCRHIFISIPIAHHPQGELDENPFQKHIKEDWTHQEVLESFPNICAGVSLGRFGVYLVVPQEEDKTFARALADEATRICYEQNK